MEKVKKKLNTLYPIITVKGIFCPMMAILDQIRRLEKTGANYAKF